MLVYLNRGLVLEAALCGLIEEYLHNIRINDTFVNFHTHTTLQHPFAHLFMDEGAKAADHFPAVVVATYDDGKPPELSGLRPEMCAISLSEPDLDTILDIDGPDGNPLPGVSVVANGDAAAYLKGLYSDERKELYGYSMRTYRQDSLSIEVWAENAVVKNQLYEDLRLYALGGMREFLADRYGDYDIKIDDDSIKGQRGSAYNIDFGTVLFGANLRFEAAYRVEQILINTDLDRLYTEVVLEGKNYVKER
jgi:hypothetical protein